MLCCLAYALYLLLCRGKATNAVNSFIAFNHICRISKHSPSEDSGSIVFLAVCRKSLPGLMPSNLPGPALYFHSKHERWPCKVESPFALRMKPPLPLRIKPVDAAMQIEGTFPYRWRSGGYNLPWCSFLWQSPHSVLTFSIVSAPFAPRALMWAM